MIKFEQDFFKEEVRCGFTIEEMMKKVWATEIEMLCEIERICNKYGLTYYADWGTLLGAIRHGGFVPWDDDMDIALKRADYMKLLEVLPKELPEAYHVSSLYTAGNHMQPTACVMNAKQLPLSDELIEQYHGCPYIVGLDLYPLDYIPREKDLADAQLAMYNVVYDMAQRFDEIEKDGQLELYLPQVEEICQVKFERNNQLKKQIWRVSDQICAMFREEESDELTWFPRQVKGDLNYHFPKEWYGSAIRKSFENIEVNVPIEYDGILKKKYGNYMEFRRGGAHNYPFYAKQETFLQSLRK